MTATALGSRRSPLLQCLIGPCLSLIVCLSACHKWVVLDPPFSAALAEQKPSAVRATLPMHSVIVYRPSVNQDTLTGWHRASETSQTPPIRLPVSSIESLETRRGNTAGTVGIVLGIGVVAAAAVIVSMAIAMSDPNY